MRYSLNSIIPKVGRYLIKRKLRTLSLLFGGLIIMSVSSLNAVTVENEHYYLPSSQFTPEGKFSNGVPVEEFSWSRIFGFLKRAIFEKKVNTVPQNPVPIEILTPTHIENLPIDKTSVVRLGHSTLLIRIGEQNWLLDPVFSERASPFSFMGPKRFHQPPISIESLPHIDGVIISHNHYDHMDEKSIKKLKDKVDRFVMPLGNAPQIIDWGVDSKKVIEIDWWQSIKVDQLEIVCTPSQHFSGRGLSDRDRTLWSSWVIKSDNSSIFFSGDSGYFSGFKTIGEKYGPFDLTLMETGAYDKDWPDVHMTPAQSSQAHKDLKGRKMIPIHNGTFDLAFHQWTDPFEQVVEIANKEFIDLLTPKMGQIVTLEDDESVEHARDLFWWRE